MREIKFIVVHCSAGMGDAETIRRHHVEFNGWSDIGYNEVIERDGRPVPGRHLERIPAQAKGWNDHALAVCLVGGRDIFDFTSAQMASLYYTLARWEREFPEAIVMGHRDFPDVTKACPRFDVRRWWYGDDYPTFSWERLKAAIDSKTVTAATNRGGESPEEQS